MAGIGGFNACIKTFTTSRFSSSQPFPVEAGTVKDTERTLPFMPGPVTYVTDNIYNGRRANFNEYIKNLLKLGPHITQGILVKISSLLVEVTTKLIRMSLLQRSIGCRKPLSNPQAPHKVTLVNLLPTISNL